MSNIFFKFIFTLVPILLCSVLNSCGPSAKELKKEGDVLYDSANYTEAIKKYSNAIELKPKYFETLYKRGLCYSKLGNFEKSIVDFDSALVIEPKNSDIHFNLGLTQFELGQYNNALQTYLTCEELGLDDPNIILQKANCYFKLDNFSKAAGNYSLALPFFPDSLSIYLTRGISFYHSNQYQLALFDLNKYLIKKTSPIIAIEYAAMSAYYLKEFGTAISYFNIIINNGEVLNAKNIDFMVKSLVAEGNKMLLLSDNENALSLFTEALSLDPHSKDALLQRGLLFLELEKNFEACEDLNNALINGALNATDILKKSCPDYY